MHRILVVEDDPEVNRLLCELLHRNGYETRSVECGLDALYALESETADLVLLDLMLPDVDGEDVLNTLRMRENLPVIVISAKGNIQDKVQLLQKGADDYITKPFHTEEVLARIVCCLRRSLQGDKPTVVLQYKTISMNTEEKTASISGTSLNLTVTEYQMLEVLLGAPKKTFSKKQLFELVWREPYCYREDAVNTHMSNLRKKLRQAGAGDCIRTVFGLGYRLCIEEEDENGTGI